MFRNVIFYDNLAEDLSGQWRFFFVQGAVLAGLGIAIFVVPDLLAAMVAAAFVFIGGVFLFLAWKARQFKSRYERWRDEFWEPFEGF